MEKFKDWIPVDNEEYKFLKKIFWEIEDYSKEISNNIEDIEFSRKINYFLENYENIIEFLGQNVFRNESTFFLEIWHIQYDNFKEKVDIFYNKFYESYKDLFL